MLFIIQVAAVSCADTHVPETTVANQSFLKVGFCKAIQLEVLVMRIGQVLFQNATIRLCSGHAEPQPDGTGMGLAISR